MRYRSVTMKRSDKYRAVYGRYRIHYKYRRLFIRGTCTVPGKHYVPVLRIRCVLSANLAGSYRRRIDLKGGRKKILLLFFTNCRQTILFCYLKR
jgi:hypothetical protein